MATLRIQSILFHNETQAIERTLDCIQRAADLAIAQGCFSAVQVAYGDCSPAAMCVSASSRAAFSVPWILP